MNYVFRVFAFLIFGAVLLTKGEDVAGDELAAIGLSVNSRERALFFFNPVDGKVTRTATSPFRAQGFGSDVLDLGLAYGGGHFWAMGYSVNLGPRPLYKIDGAKGAIAETLNSEFRPNGFGKDLAKLSLTFGDGFLWALGDGIYTGRRALYKISPTNGTTVATLTFDARPPRFDKDYADGGAAFGDGHIWFLGESALNNGRPLYKVNVKDGAVAPAITTRFRSLENDVAKIGLAYGRGFLWAFGNSVNGRARPLFKINPTDGTIAETISTSFAPPGSATDVAALGLAYISRPKAE